MNSNTKPLVSAVFSDIHLGHKKNPTSNIIKALEESIFNNQQSTQWDILYLAGDVFDTLLELKSDEVGEIELFATNLLRHCSKHDIVLRVLEGTPSHDWKQSQVFSRMKEIAKIELDYQYIDTVSIEYIEKFNIHVLYVPDEPPFQNTDETFNEVKRLLQINGLTKVDYAIMHGQFDFQLPAHIKNLPRHSSKDYLDIVRYYIFIGHIHTHSLFDRIMAQGSFDRLSHGQEELKGYAVSIVDEYEQNIFFVENKLARTYITINCENLDLKNTIEYIRDKCFSLASNACVRIKAELKHPIFSNMSELIKMYPTITWSKLVAEEKDKKTIVEKQEDDILYTPITIAKDNIVSLIRTRLDLSVKDSKFNDSCIAILEQFK